MGNVYTIDREKFEEFERHLRRLGFSFEDRPHQIFLARYEKFTVNLYESGKITFGGSGNIMSEVEWFVKSKLGGKPVGAAQGVGLEGRTRIGSDEAGKGDFFGPLVAAGVLVTQETEPLLLKARVKDSKLVRSEQGIRRLSKAIRDVVKKDGYDIVMIGPARYNELYEKLGNMNSILGWAHARVIENLLKRHGECSLAVADQFGDEEHIRRALMVKGKEITLIQIPKGERDLAVAAASILARDRFLFALNRLHEEFDIELPRGSGNETMKAGERFAKRYGKVALKKVAKLHFSIYNRIS